MSTKLKTITAHVMTWTLAVSLCSSVALFANDQPNSEEGAANGRVPAEELLPAETKALIVLRDIDEMREKAKATDLGKIFEQDELQPLAEELRAKLEQALIKADGDLGISFERIKGVRTGEVAFGVVLPEPDSYASILMADVKGNEDEADLLLADVAAELTAREAEQQPALAEGAVAITHFELPLKRGEAVVRNAYFGLHAGYLFASSDEATVRSIVRSISNSQPEEFQSLADLDMYQQVARRLGEAVGSPEPDIRWFVEPFGLSKAIRNTIPDDLETTNYLSVLERKGFDAIQGVGGDIVFGAKPFDILHRTFVYAPPSADAEQGERYTDAARMLDFDNSDELPLFPQRFVPTNVSTYLSFRWNMQKAFNSVGSVVNGLADEDNETAWQNFLRDMKHAVDGPQVDLEEAAKGLGSRVTVIGDVKEPIGPSSERLLVAIRIKDSEILAEALQKIMEVEPGVVPIEFGAEDIVIYFRDPEVLAAIDEGTGPGAEFDPLNIDVDDGTGESAAEDDDPEESIAGWNSYSVVGEYLFISNDIEFMQEILTPREGEELKEAIDYIRVQVALRDLVDRTPSFSQFGRTKEILRVSYELLRQGRMPESQSLVGTLLNRFTADSEPGVLRDQQIDPAAFPPGADSYDRLIARFIGPSGWTLHVEPNGFFLTGGLLPVEHSGNGDTTDEDSGSSKESDSVRTANNDDN